MEYLAHPNLETRKYYTKSWKGRSKGLSLLEYVYEFSDLRVDALLLTVSVTALEESVSDITFARTVWAL